ncbi:MULTISPECIES: DUF6082 family protein [unclassified Streptomyces]|uniref:DUF6082 family protein n=1 Tax=Streptomyces sp. NBC_00060 TaxID=2975636 RepID=A0AAU2H0J6_9ACTN
MAASSRTREIYILALTTLASCAGSVGLTLALTSLPVVQSTATGNAGQAYGAAAAATSVVVLVYLARTFRHQGDEARLHREALQAQTAELSLQRKALEAQMAEITLQRETSQNQHKTTQRSAEAAVRARHIKLAEMAIDDPLLMQCWPDHETGTSADRRKQYMYCNLIISHHCMCHELGYFTDEEVEASLCHLFSNEIVRSFWEGTRAARARTTPHGGTMRKFYEIVELAYLRQLRGEGVAG